MTLSNILRALTLALSAACLALAVGAQNADLSEGEIRKVDQEGGKVTLAHGEIKSLDMPPMTMVFRVRDAKLLDELVPGDRVRFAAERIDGSYTVTSLSKAP